MRLTDTQKGALDLLYNRSAFAGGTVWLGAKEGVSGTTLGALEDRGLARTKWEEKPYRRLVGQLTTPGADWVESRRIRTPVVVSRYEIDVLEGIVRTADAGDVRGALATIEKLRTVYS